ncbi:hypothetical protein, partial [Escherichia coli]|uniref:hypothetical protein n=1 Tax=Escherichia coli TaxID=562 RepID=UPI001BAF37E0
MNKKVSFYHTTLYTNSRLSFEYPEIDCVDCMKVKGHFFVYVFQITLLLPLIFLILSAAYSVSLSDVDIISFVLRLKPLVASRCLLFYF